MTDKTPEFMLEEFKQIANGYQDLHAQQNELIKFYLTLVAIPASVLAVVAQFAKNLPIEAPTQAATPAATQVATQAITQTASQTTTLPITPTIVQQANGVILQTAPSSTIADLAMPILLALLMALCVIGLAVVLSLVSTRAEALLYVKTVNGVRRYFIEHDPEGTLRKYLVLPDIDILPHYWEGIRSRSFWNVTMIASLNTAVFFSTCFLCLSWLGVTQWAIVVSIVGGILWFGLQEFLHWRIMKTKDEKYIVKFASSFPIKNNVIGVDLDGVLGNLAEGIISKARIQYGLSIDLKDITSHRLQDCTPLTDVQVKDLFESTDVFQTLPPIPGACEALKKFRSKRWIVQIITDRFWTKQDWSIAKTWLDENGFEWDHLNLVRAQEKAAYAKSHGILVFVEDNYETAVGLSPVCDKVYLLDWPYNRGSLPKNARRVSGWEDILQDLLQ